MALARPLITLFSLIILAVGILFQFFIILSGAVSGTPENKVYFLRAATAGIGNAPSEAAWTFFSICNYVGGETTACRAVKAALPFRPSQNFGATTGYPDVLNSSKYFYLSRCAFAFWLIALFFAVIALFTSLLALCTRLGAYLTGFTTFLAFVFQALAASLMTAWTVLARNNFRSAGIQANLGAYGYGFSWASVLAFLISMIMFCAAGGASKKDRSSSSSSSKKASRFGRKRGSRAQVTTINDVENGGIKSEYS